MASAMLVILCQHCSVALFVRNFVLEVFLPQLNVIRHLRGLISEAKDTIHVPKLLLTQLVSFSKCPQYFTGPLASFPTPRE
jgi:hypothetical protein